MYDNKKDEKFPLIAVWKLSSRKICCDQTEKVSLP